MQVETDRMIPVARLQKKLTRKLLFCSGLK
jgi:hypothetical protein